MWHWRFIGGFAISIGGGQIVIWPLMKLLRWYSKAPQHISLKNQRGLSWVTGIVEEGLYTSALIVGAYQWIGIWLAMKVAARWKSEEKPHSEILIWRWFRAFRAVWIPGGVVCSREIAMLEIEKQTHQSYGADSEPHVVANFPTR